jgi:hypothetical protein
MIHCSIIYRGRPTAIASAIARAGWWYSRRRGSTQRFRGGLLHTVARAGIPSRAGCPRPRPRARSRSHRTGTPARSPSSTIAALRLPAHAACACAAFAPRLRGMRKSPPHPCSRRRTTGPCARAGAGRPAGFRRFCGGKPVRLGVGAAPAFGCTVPGMPAFRVNALGWQQVALAGHAQPAGAGRAWRRKRHQCG